MDPYPPVPYTPVFPLPLFPIPSLFPLPLLVPYSAPLSPLLLIPQYSVHFRQYSPDTSIECSLSVQSNCESVPEASLKGLQAAQKSALGTKRVPLGC